MEESEYDGGTKEGWYWRNVYDDEDPYDSYWPYYFDDIAEEWHKVDKSNLRCKGVNYENCRWRDDDDKWRICGKVWCHLCSECIDLSSCTCNHKNVYRAHMRNHFREEICGKFPGPQFKIRC
ncbi:hypothetical protein AGMMS50233_00150 [Endomicrobiia bacterium]|nr:hypothetical protein AGMMS50233_00150 [Endomicrobiia bacterium]